VPRGLCINPIETWSNNSRRVRLIAQRLAGAAVISIGPSLDARHVHQRGLTQVRNGDRYRIRAAGLVAPVLEMISHDPLWS